MLLGAAIFPETSKYGGGPENMAIVAARQRWRRCLRERERERETAGFKVSAGRAFVAHLQPDRSRQGTGCLSKLCEHLICVENVNGTLFSL